MMRSLGSRFLKHVAYFSFTTIDALYPSIARKIIEFTSESDIPQQIQFLQVFGVNNCFHVVII